MAVQLEFKEVWKTYEGDRGRGCTTGICDENDGQPIEEIGYTPPAHPFCECEVVTRLVVIGEV
ncbi:MAG: hypothetical protein AB1757_21260 [Acidobacteriota bacterium]